MIHRLLVPLAVAALVAGCTGVPTSSTPQAVQSVNPGAQPTGQALKPTKNEAARQIVNDFLTANTIDPGKHTSARAFLTTAARSRWSDAKVTILDSPYSVSTYDQASSSVTLTGRPFGILDENGIFHPNFAGGTYEETFKLARPRGQYRIDQLRSGLVITEDVFAQNYKQYPLYFFDNDNRYLVPDPRYTDILDRTPLAEWLLDRLAAGPRPELQNAVSSDTLPTQADPSRMSVQVDATTSVEIPGSSQLDRSGINRLAAQLSQTLDDPTSSGDIVVTDGGRPVPVPAVHGTVFGSGDFDNLRGPTPPSPAVYYVAAGAVVDSTGHPMSGPLGRNGANLASVALSRPVPTGPILAAAVQGSGTAARLLVGNQESGVRPTQLVGQLTRPAFAPGRPEIWVGNGTKVERVTTSATGGRPEVHRVPALDAGVAGRVLALRLSPDGARVAMVLGTGPSNGGQLFVGSIVRDSGQVTVDAVTRISPDSAVIADVAWLNPTRVFAVGVSASTGDGLSFDTGVDGSDWTAASTGLSKAPDSVTVTANRAAWLSANGFVWEQSFGQWTSPSGGQTQGTAPVYLE